jgi:hypothetical protein
MMTHENVNDLAKIKLKLDLIKKNSDDADFVKMQADRAKEIINKILDNKG